MFKVPAVTILTLLLSISSLQALTIKSGESIQSKSNEAKTVSSVNSGSIPGEDMCKNAKVEGNEFTFFSTAERPGCAPSDKKPYKDEWLEFSHSNRSEWIIKMPRNSGLWLFNADVSYDGDFGDRNTVFQIHDGYGKCEGDCKHGSGKPPSWLGVTSGYPNLGLFEQCFYFSDGYGPNGEKCNLPAAKSFNLKVVIDLEKFDQGTVTYIVDNILLRTKDIKTRTGNPFEPHFGIYRINGKGYLTAKYQNVSFEQTDRKTTSKIIGGATLNNSESNDDEGANNGATNARVSDLLEADIKSTMACKYTIQKEISGDPKKYTMNRGALNFINSNLIKFGQNNGFSAGKGKGNKDADIMAANVLSIENNELKGRLMLHRSWKDVAAGWSPGSYKLSQKMAEDGNIEGSYEFNYGRDKGHLVILNCK